MPDINQGQILTPGTLEHHRDRLQSMAETVCRLAHGQLDTEKSIAQLAECIALLEEDLLVLGEGLASEHRQRLQIVR